MSSPRLRLDRGPPGGDHSLTPAREREVTHLVDRLFRTLAGQLTAGVVRILGPSQIDLAADVVQETMLRALRTWPFHGIPDVPAAWLMRTARNRAVDLVRRARLGEESESRIAHHFTSLVDDSGGERREDTLHLMLACADPALPVDAVVAILLQAVGGLGSREIARAMLLPEATVAQRIVRAKKRMREWPADEELFARPIEELAQRRDVALRAIYLLFNEGHNASEGDEVLRGELAREATRLVMLLASVPELNDPAVEALAALILLHASRFPSRQGDDGSLVLLADQDRTLWDEALLQRGFHHLARAAESDTPTRYHLEAAIAAEHARAGSFEATNWDGIVDLYGGLMVLAPSPVVRTNRAVALVLAGRVDEGEAELEAIADEPGVSRYGWFFATRGWLRDRLGDLAGARDDYRAALARQPSAPHRTLLLSRLARLDG
jgi:RNA polymerase sigma-70 factor (ECF subfamily)